MTEKTIALQNGLRLRCFEAGEGPRTIVLLHGAGVDSASLSWREVLPLLAEAGCRVIAPDLPGYGGSDRIEGVYSLPFYADTVAQFIEALHCGPVVLGGLSLGGGITLLLALERPELFEAIIPVDAWGLFNKLRWHRLMHGFVHSALNKNLYRWSASRWMVRWSLTASLFGDKKRVTPALVGEVLAAMQAPGAGEPFRSFQMSELTPTGVTTELFGRLREIDLPALFIHGERDSAVPLAGAIEAQKRMKNARLHIMHGCKHWPQKERPAEFAEAVRGFLDTLSP